MHTVACCTVEEYERLIWLGFGCSVMCRGATCSFICKPSVSQAPESFFARSERIYFRILIFGTNMNIYHELEAPSSPSRPSRSSRRRRTPFRAARCRASSGSPWEPRHRPHVWHDSSDSCHERQPYLCRRLPEVDPRPGSGGLRRVPDRLGRLRTLHHLGLERHQRADHHRRPQVPPNARRSR